MRLTVTLEKIIKNPFSDYLNYGMASLEARYSITKITSKAKVMKKGNNVSNMEGESANMIR